MYLIICFQKEEAKEETEEEMLKNKTKINRTKWKNNSKSKIHAYGFVNIGPKPVINVNSKELF